MTHEEVKLALKIAKRYLQQSINITNISLKEINYD